MSEVHLRQGLVVCLTGRMPAKRDDIIAALARAGITVLNDARRSSVVVYSDDAVEKRTAKFATGRNYGKIVHVDDFLAQVRAWDPSADDYLGELLDN